MKIKTLTLLLGIFTFTSCKSDVIRTPDVSTSDSVREMKELSSDTLFSKSVKHEYFLMVKRYADFMIENGRDRYGKEHSPLFATTMNRFTGDIYRKNPPNAPKGIRDRDRTYRGSNPSNHTGLFGILYKLSELTGNERYAEEADESIIWFFKNCQIKKTGLMPWGEHIGLGFFQGRNYSQEISILVT